MQKIKQLKGGEKKVDIEVIVLEAPSPKEVSTKFGFTNVASVLVGDDTGECKLTLWGDDHKKVKTGDRVRVSSGYTTLFRDTVQINVGKFGKMEVNPDVPV